MALPVGATLAEIRDRAATRLRFGGAGRLSTQAHANLDEWIFDAHAELVLEAPWIVLQQVEEIDLIDEQQSYDIPDGWLPGRINEITILSNQDGTQHEYRMEKGVRYYERDAFLDTTKSLPLRWTIENQLIEIYPKPDASEYQKMRLSGLKTPAPPREDTDRMVVDETALLQRVEMLGWINLGNPGRAEQLRTRHEKYLKNRRSQEALGEKIVLGGRRSRIHNRPRRRLSQNEEVDWAFWYPES